ncbi:hypothetical protein EDD21DRAFT_391089 [Dissophora ornata]|nr:hypothetical protein EDD21DRAFT_391089 [Dissophora ornata]
MCGWGNGAGDSRSPIVLSLSLFSFALCVPLSLSVTLYLHLYSVLSSLVLTPQLSLFRTRSFFPFFPFPLPALLCPYLLTTSRSFSLYFTGTKKLKNLTISRPPFVFFTVLFPSRSRVHTKV